MTLEITTLAWGYVAFGLLVILGAWLAFVWRRRVIRRNPQRIHACPHCGEKIRLAGEMLFVRCPQCGARLSVAELTGLR